MSLHEKGLLFDIQTIDLAAKAQHEPGFATKSLTSRVPTLIHDEFSLSESSAIAEYIDEVFPGTIPSRTTESGKSASGASLAPQRSHTYQTRASY
ncbi:glutathione S-transferase N-terminal domain-containing protein [Nostoc cycadae]|uniref:glutathione S-transferase N-terminal domain-containing protein n=1 Tax=Nostoc cycadae TaxID=246795 RepID=UPI003BF582F7